MTDQIRQVFQQVPLPRNRNQPTRGSISEHGVYKGSVERHRRMAHVGRHQERRAGGFTLDRALAGRRQAAIAVTGDAIQLSPLHARCPTYIMRSDENRLERAESPIGVQVDDMIVAGTTVVALRAPE